MSNSKEATCTRKMSQEGSALTLSPVWKSYLYQLQEEAPTPAAVPSKTVDEASRPAYFHEEYHSYISHNDSILLLTKSGQYLVRESGKNRKHHTLSLRFLDEIKHYRLYYDGQFYVGDKKFDHLVDLVADGLITMFLELKAGDYIHLMCRSASYEQSPYFTLNERKRRTLSLSRERPLPIDQPQSLDIEYDKAHAFRIQTFKGLHWCDLCGNFMWGLIAQGVRCEDCGFTAHRKCSEKIPANCCPDLKYLRGVFGVDLTTLNKAHGTRLPFIVDMCIKEIEKRGLNSEGIYRVSGLRDEVEALRIAFDRDGEKTDLSHSSWDDIHVVAGVLKLYFRLLPIPLIVFQVYPLIMAAAKEPDEKRRIERTRDAIKQLPPAHYNALKHLSIHLNKIAENKEKNKMSSLNLSTVLCPTLFPVPDLTEMSSTGSIPDLHLEATSLDLIIRQPHLIFPII